MTWLVLVLSGCFELVGIVALNEFAKASKRSFILLIILSFSASFSCIIYVLNYLSLGVSYAVWTGIGTAGGVLIGIFKYKESKSPLKLFFIAVILLSCIGLKFIS